MKFAISRWGEHYEGDFDSEEEAAKEAAAVFGDGSFYVGCKRKPRQPETFINADGMLDRLGEGDEDWSSDWCEWDYPTREQIAELQTQFEATMASWLDRHNLRPRWFMVDHVVSYTSVDGNPVRTDSL